MYLREFIKNVIFVTSFLKYKTMARVAGFTVERTLKGKPTFARIDLRKHAFLIPILENNGFEIEQPIKWTAKMKKSFAEAENGEVYSRSLEDILNV